MSRILTAFAREESREAVNTMLERCGMPPYVSFRSGAGNARTFSASTPLSSAALAMTSSVA